MSGLSSSVLKVKLSILFLREFALADIILSWRRFPVLMFELSFNNCKSFGKPVDGTD